MRTEVDKFSCWRKGRWRHDRRIEAAPLSTVYIDMELEAVVDGLGGNKL